MPVLSVIILFIKGSSEDYLIVYVRPQFIYVPSKGKGEKFVL
jgi:hypothetical protein